MYPIAFTFVETNDNYDWFFLEGPKPLMIIETWLIWAFHFRSMLGRGRDKLSWCPIVNSTD